MKPTGMAARGYSLMLVLAVTSALLIAVFVVLMSVSGGIEANRGRWQQQQAFYRCDGVGRALRRAALDTLADDPSADVQEALCGNPALGGCHAASSTLTPPGTADGALPALDPALQLATLEIDAAPAPIAITSGPLEGLSGTSSTLQILVDGRMRDSGVVCRTKQTLAVTTVPLTSFGLFIALDSYTWTPLHPPAATTPEPAPFAVHANGDLSWAGYVVQRISASGALTTTSGATPALAATPPVPFATTSDSAVAGRALDAQQHMPPLGPLPGTLPSAQLGTDTQGHPVTNVQDGAHGERNTFRFLVDPVVSGDGAMRAFKLAHKADLRIIDGSWYLRPADGSWPGTLVWTDHPVPPDAALSVLEPQPPTMPTQGTRYSYYATDASGGTLRRTSVEPPAVVSYGPLAPRADGVLRPAYVGGDGCGAGKHFGVVDDAHYACGIDRGARQTLLDPTQVKMPGGSSDARLLPLNFDVDALAQALGATGESGELGALLAAQGRGFNGIVYITSTWVDDGVASLPASLDGRPPLQDLEDELVSSLRPRCHSHCAEASAPDVVRIVNAANLDAFPHGLTIASNLPVVVQGNVNATATSPGSMLVAGDTVTLVSSAWTDDVIWDEHPGGTHRPVAVATTFRMSVITGQTRATGSDPTLGSDGALRVWEDWASAPSARPALRGSLIVGFHPVYAQHVWPPASSSGTGEPGTDLRPGLALTWDTRLGSPGMAPPGTPSTQDVHARSWEQ